MRTDSKLTQLVQEAGWASVTVRQTPAAVRDCMEKAEAMLREIVQMMSAELAQSNGSRKERVFLNFF